MAECFGDERHAPQTASVDRIGRQLASFCRSAEVVKSPRERRLWSIDVEYAEQPSLTDKAKYQMTASFRLIAIYAEAEMCSLARRYVADCAVTVLVPELPRPWFLVKTRTDAERDLLNGNDALLKEFKAVFQERECPDEIVQGLTFTFQSQETVERDYAGNWHCALK